MVTNKLKLGLIYKYNNKLCNFLEEDHKPYKENYSLVYSTLTLKDFYSGKYIRYLNYTNSNLKAFYEKKTSNDHFDKKKMAEFAIFEPLLLETGELMAIKKNFWINIFIRKVKKYYYNKINNSNFIIYRNKIKYDHFNQIIKQYVWVEKIVLNSNFKNVKSYVLQLNEHYKDMKENNEKLNIKNENSGYEITFTMENCNKKIISF